MKPLFLRHSLLVTAVLIAVTACGGNDSLPEVKASLIGRYAHNVSEGMSEIVALHAASKSAFITVDTVNVPSSFQRISLRNVSSTALANPTTASNLESGATTSVAAHVNDTNFTAGGVQTLAISGNLLAIAVKATPKTNNGVVAFYRLDNQGNATYLKKVTVGSLPDGMAFSPDGSRLVVANEAEIDGDKNFVLAADKSNDPLGTISIITIANGTPADTAQTLDFTAFDDAGARVSERPSGVRIGIVGNDFSRDAEPEYVSITADGSQAYVTLQENNAVAIVDLANARIERIVALGYKDHGLASNALAPSDRVSATAPFSLKSYANLFGIYMPDAIASFSIGNTPYFITANEGDDRDDFLATGETSRVKDLTLDATAFPNAATLKGDAELGRLTVIKTLGLNSSNQHEKLYALGGRSFSIYNAATGAQVFDSGVDLEQRAYATLPTALLGKSQVLGRLDNKGPEPESVVVGQIGSKTYAFVALERTNAILMYDVSNPAAPVFVQWLQNTTDMDNGDISPEGLAFVPAAQSPTGQPLLLVGHEVSGSMAVWEIK
ncbi:MAG: hypothetical protein RJB34_727 [Pseudomonadota bacterium]|jgi:hypothetical protein